MTTATARSVQRPADLLLAAAFAAVTQVEVWVFSLGDDHPIGLRVVASALTLVASGVLAWRRSWPVAAFWGGLSTESDPMARASKLESFYFTGLPGFEPVVSMSHYGNNPKGLGQVRTNQFLQGPPTAPRIPWMMREFKLVSDCVSQPSKPSTRANE